MAASEASAPGSRSASGTASSLPRLCGSLRTRQPRPGCDSPPASRPAAGGAAPARRKRCVRPPPPGPHRPGSIARSRRSSAAGRASGAPCPRSAAAPRPAAAAPRRPRFARRAPSRARRHPAWRLYFRFRPPTASLAETAELCPPSGGGSANERRVRQWAGPPRGRMAGFTLERAARGG